MKWAAVCVLVAICLFILKKGKNNVCKTFGDYYTDRDNNPNCYYNPDHELEAPEIIRRHGYPVETYQVTTDDGYILTLYRIPHGLKNKESIKKPVFIIHGITMNCGSFLLIGKRSFAFMLADAGYDVWLGNFRGTRYSRNHTQFDVNSAQFWNYSIEELGVYDVRAQLELVTQQTNQNVIYLGFSLGAAAGYVYGSIYPDLASKNIEYFVAIAPGVFLKHSIIYVAGYIWPYISPVLNYITNGEIYPRPPLPKFLYRSICFPFPIQMNICQIVDMIMLGYNYEENDPETIPVNLLHNIDSTTTNMFDHYLQISLSGNFQRFDYGDDQNKLLYGYADPPHYNLSNIQFDNYIVYSENDKIAHTETVDILYSKLPNKTYFKNVYKIKNTKVNHVDILSGKNAHTLVYVPIIEELKRREQIINSST